MTPHCSLADTEPLGNRAIVITSSQTGKHLPFTMGQLAKADGRFPIGNHRIRTRLLQRGRGLLIPPACSSQKRRNCQLHLSKSKFFVQKAMGTRMPDLLHRTRIILTG